jgi:hypothetical protein
MRMPSALNAARSSRRAFNMGDAPVVFDALYAKPQSQFRLRRKSQIASLFKFADPVKIRGVISTQSSHVKLDTNTYNQPLTRND